LDKMPVSQLLGIYEIENSETPISNQLNIF
jgi:hypothetical protein